MKKKDFNAIEAFENYVGTKVTEKDVFHILLSLRPAIIKRIQEKQDAISSVEIIKILTQGE